MAKLAFYVCMKVVDNSILDIQALVSFHLDHNSISNLQSITIVLYCEDKMTSLFSWLVSSKILALLEHNFFMKDVDISLRFPQPLR